MSAVQAFARQVIDEILYTPPHTMSPSCIGYVVFVEEHPGPGFTIEGTDGQPPTSEVLQVVIRRLDKYGESNGFYPLNVIRMQLKRAKLTTNPRHGRLTASLSTEDRLDVA